jgi:hypothetical protein
MNDNQNLINEMMEKTSEALKLFYENKIDLTELLKQVQTLAFQTGVDAGTAQAMAAMKETLGNMFPASKGKL